MVWVEAERVNSQGGGARVGKLVRMMAPQARLFIKILEGRTFKAFILLGPTHGNSESGVGGWNQYVHRNPVLSLVEGALSRLWGLGSGS